MIKKINEIKKMSLPIKASLIFILASIFEKGVGLLTIPIFTRILSEEVFGQISVFNSWSGILNVIISFSLVGGVINNAMLDYKDDKDGFISSILSLIFFSSILYYLVYRVVLYYFGNLLNYNLNLIDFMFLNFAFNSSFGLWAIKKRFNYDYKLVIIISFIMAVSSPLLSYFLLVHTKLPKLNAKIYGDNIIILLINIILFVYILIKGKKIINLKYWKYGLKFNVPLIPHYLSHIILAQSDRIMISKYINEASAGIYTLSYTIASIINIIIAAINSSFIPWTYQNMKCKKYSEIGKNANKLALIVGVIALLFILFAPEFIRIMAPISYYKAIYVIPPVVLGTYYIFIYTFFGNIEFYYKKTNYIMIASVISAGINIYLNTIFIPKYSFIGAGYTTMCSYFIMIIIHYIFMRKIEKNKIYEIKKLILIVLIVTIFGLTLVLLYDYMLIRMGLVLCVLVCIFIKRNLLIKKLRRSIKYD